MSRSLTYASRSVGPVDQMVIFIVLSVSLESISYDVDQSGIDQSPLHRLCQTLPLLVSYLSLSQNSSQPCYKYLNLLAYYKTMLNYSCKKGFIVQASCVDVDEHEPC